MTKSAAANVPAIIQRAQWIWPQHSWDLHNCYALFRKTFALPRAPKTALLYITADQSYQLYVNGKYVCRGPARGFQSHWPYDQVDVARFLRCGPNIIAVRAYNPGFSNFQYISQGWAGLLVAARWGATKILADRSWKCRRQIGVKADTVPASLQLFPQEHFDANLECDDWMALDFGDAEWHAPRKISCWNSMPWYNLEARMIPLLAERRIFPRALIGVGAGRCAADFRLTRDVTRLRSTEDLRHKPAAEAGRTLEVPPTGRNRFRSYLIDFGRTVVGSVSLNVAGAKGGEVIDTLHVETIDAKKLRPHLNPDAWCRMSFGSRLICRPGRTQHTFYHYYGFRYLVVTVRDTAAPLKVDLALNWVGYPLRWNGSFTSSDRQLEKIWQTCAWTQQCCSLDAYVDTPWREQAQWWGDARVQAWNTFHLDGDARLFRRGIHCIASQTTPNGLTYGHAPTMAHECILPDFTLIWLLTIWDHYWQTGSLEAFRAHQEVIAGALEYFRSQTNRKTGLVPYDPRYWLFLDWTGIFKDGYPSVYNLWLLVALDKVARMYRLAGQIKPAREIESWALRLRAALRKLIDKRGLMRDGITFKGKLVRHASVHAQTLAVMAGLNPPTERAMLKGVLLPFIREKAKPKVYPSAYWITYVFSVLAEKGYAPEVVAFIRKYWTPMAAHGTTFENFNPTPGETSFSHAWSAHPLFHLMQTLGGIRQTAPGWKEVAFSPAFLGRKGGATIPSPRGNINSFWERKGAVVHVRLSLPKGVRARVEFAGQKPQILRGERAWIVNGKWWALSQTKAKKQ